VIKRAMSTGRSVTAQAYVGAASATHPWRADRLPSSTRPRALRALPKHQHCVCIQHCCIVGTINRSGQPLYKDLGQHPGMSSALSAPETSAPSTRQEDIQ
jgi:hypothetical protein